uniref:Ubiquitin-like domain-containing protein n=1 Tax=Denticeps clupeoides TaxID=299321 RepID=A0AAY4A2K7_9TELE
MEKVYQVNVIRIEGQSMTVDVAKSDEEFNNMSVLEFKKKLLEKLPPGSGTEASNLRVIFVDKQLQDDKKFSDYKIKDKSTLLVVARMDGGH